MIKRYTLLILILSCICAHAQQTLERYALVAGANFGGTSRALLEYAHKDAKEFSQVMELLGGTPKANQVILLEPTAQSFKDGMDSISALIRSRPSSTRKEIVVYYSGHADEKGLYFGNSNYDYRILRKHIDEIPASVKITILDACASGAITKLKGGYRKQAFLIDASNDLSGYAFITSSANNENSQESDDIGGSFFTHYLLSGLRGAADVSRDGKITLGEAYQFAFNETLQRTQNTAGGSQHPSYDMKLSGTGDVVMTDLRAIQSSLVLAEDLKGRVYIKYPDGQLIAEMYKTSGRTIEIGLPSKKLEISLEYNGQWFATSVSIPKTEKKILYPADFKSVPSQATVSRGDTPPAMDTTVSVQDTAAIDVPNTPAPEKYGFQFGFKNYERKKVGGTQISLFKNYSATKMSGSQFSLLGFNRIQNDIDGLQFALFSNVGTKNIGMGQISLISNFSRKNLNGVQTTVFLNNAKNISGLQLGIVNTIKGTGRGLQVGAYNLSKAFYGIQYGTIFNYSRYMEGICAANVICVTDTMSGVQIAPINKAKIMNGLQIGLINVSDTMNGLSLGLINYSNNGQLTLNVWRDELDMQYLSLKSGTPHFYTFLTWGRNLTHDNTANALGGGLGFRAGMKRVFVELENHHMWFINKLDKDPDNDDYIMKTALNLDVKINNHLALFGGISYNILWNYDTTRVVHAWSDFEKHFTKLATGTYGWPGIQFGIKAGWF